MGIGSSELKSTTKHCYLIDETGTLKLDVEKIGEIKRNRQYINKNNRLRDCKKLSRNSNGLCSETFPYVSAPISRAVYGSKHRNSEASFALTCPELRESFLHSQRREHVRIQ